MSVSCKVAVACGRIPAQATLCSVVGVSRQPSLPRIGRHVAPGIWRPSSKTCLPLTEFADGHSCQALEKRAKDPLRPRFQLGEHLHGSCHPPRVHICGPWRYQAQPLMCLST